MKNKTQQPKQTRPKIAYGIAAWAAIMAGGFALAAGQVGCAQTIGGALYGASRDYDKIMDSGAEGSRERKLNRGE